MDIFRPKKPKNAFLIFRCEVWESVCRDMKSSRIEIVSPEIGKRWHALSEQEKKLYTNKMNELKSAYNQSLKKYREGPLAEYLLSRDWEEADSESDTSDSSSDSDESESDSDDSEDDIAEWKKKNM